MVQITEELFVMVMNDYTITWTRECSKCYAQIAFAGQGHHCPGLEETQIEIDEAEKWAEVLKGVVQLYKVPQ
jgi:hypothetical protein